MMVAREPHPQAERVAAAARLAMEEVFPASDAAQPAVVAMELLFGHIVVEEAAYQARVQAEAHPARGAGLGHRLARVAQSAHHLLDLRAVHVMATLGVLHAAECIGLWIDSQHPFLQNDKLRAETQPLTSSPAFFAALWQCLHQKISPQQGATNFALRL